LFNPCYQEIGIKRQKRKMKRVNGGKNMNFGKAFLAGVIGGVVMTVLMFMWDE